MRSTLWLVAGTVLVLAGCKSASSNPASGMPSGDAAVITIDEIVRANRENAYLIVEKERPAWLRGRGGARSFQSAQVDAAFPLVYLDDTRLGALQTLRSVPTSQLREIRFVSPANAILRWGQGLDGGVIHVLTKPPSD
jgi:hypothetical protein